MEHRKKNRLTAFIVIATALVPLDSAHSAKIRKMRFLMGTLLQIEAEGEDIKKVEESIESAFDEVLRLEQIFSNYKENSEISKINRNAHPKPMRASEETVQFISDALYFSKMTDGAFDITIEPLSKIWRLRERRLDKIPNQESIEKTREKVGYHNVEISTTAKTVRFKLKGMAIDTGGIGKGVALDQALKKLREYPVQSVTLNFGGEILYWSENTGEKEFSIKNPFQPQMDWGRFTVTISSIPNSISTSGNYERFVTVQATGGNESAKKIGHIINPKTGFPVQNELRSVTVIAPRAAEADALSTALFVMGLEKAKSFIEGRGLEAVLLYETVTGELNSYSSKGLKTYVNHD